MATKNRRLVLVIILAYAILFCNGLCNKMGLHCANNVYSFELPVKAIPVTDSILVGDSITLMINEPTHFKDVNSGQVIDYSGAANLGSAIAFQQYDSTIGSFVGAASFLSYSLLKGQRLQERTPELYRKYRFVEEKW